MDQTDESEMEGEGMTVAMDKIVQEEDTNGVEAEVLQLPWEKEGYEPEELWTAAMCADFAQIKVNTWHGYAGRKTVSNPVPNPYRHWGSTPVWDAAQVRYWYQNKPGPGNWIVGSERKSPSGLSEASRAKAAATRAAKKRAKAAARAAKKKAERSAETSDLQ